MSDAIDEVTVGDLAVLAAAVRAGSFSAAGRSLGLSRTAVSRVVARLEGRLGVRLFTRTTRRVALTAPAVRLARELSNLLPGLRDVLEGASSEEREVSGVVRVSVSHAYGRRVLLPSVVRFAAEHPKIAVDVRLTERIEDLVGDQVDIALRMGPLRESSLVVRALGRLDVVLVGTPSLVKRHGAPRTLDDVEAGHVPAVGFRVPESGEPFAWPALDPGAPRELRRILPGQVRLWVDSIEAAADLARASVGVALLPRYLVADDLARGRLVALLSSVSFVGPDVHLCFLERRLMPRRVRLLVDHLLREPPPTIAPPTTRRPRR